MTIQLCCPVYQVHAGLFCELLWAILLNLQMKKCLHLHDISTLLQMLKQKSGNIINMSSVASSIKGQYLARVPYIHL